MEENQKNLNKDYLVEMLEKQYEKQDVDRILDGYKSKRIVSLRINTIKADIEDVKQRLRDYSVDFEKVSWSDTALIIKNKLELFFFSKHSSTALKYPFFPNKKILPSILWIINVKSNSFFL